ncbi:hypothetical protein E4U26_008077 [Claviceps purpurea]|nr:hypothetical protein E4U26_008077 [Claviceps purpurea]
MTTFQGLFQGANIPDLSRFAMDEDADDDLRLTVSILWSCSALGAAKKCSFDPINQRLQEYSTVAAQLQRVSALAGGVGRCIEALERREAL